MLELGFEPQVRSILKNVRPDRQTLLFSATFKRRIERLANQGLRRPVRITVGKVGQAAENIRQVVWVFKDHGGKYQWLLARLPAFLGEGKVMIFVSGKAGCDELVKNMNTEWRRRNGVPEPEDPSTKRRGSRYVKCCVGGTLFAASG